MTPTAAIVAALLCAAGAVLTFNRARRYRDQVDERAIPNYLRSSCYTGAFTAFIIVWGWGLILP